MSLDRIRARALAAVSVAALLTMACGGGEPAAPPTAAGPLTIAKALAIGGPVTVLGYVVAPDGEPVKLCSVLLESYPPQCGGPSLVVAGLDLGGVAGLDRAEEPAFAHTAWTNDQVELAGRLQDGVLTVG